MLLLKTAGGDMFSLRRKPVHALIHMDDLPHQDEIEAARHETHQAVQELNNSFEKLNKALEKRGDTAYNIFVATGGRRRQKNADKN